MNKTKYRGKRMNIRGEKMYMVIHLIIFCGHSSDRGACYVLYLLYKVPCREMTRIEICDQRNPLLV